MRIVIAGYYGFDNTGDEAILAALLAEDDHVRLTDASESAHQRRVVGTRAVASQRYEIGRQALDEAQGSRPSGGTRALDEHVARCVRWPGLAERVRQHEQHRAPRERNLNVGVAHEVAARVHDQRVRSKQRFNLLEADQPRLAALDRAPGRHVQDSAGALDLCRESRYACAARGTTGAGFSGCSA